MRFPGPDRVAALMREAADWGVDVVVYPELALTTFWPRWAIEDEGEVCLGVQAPA